MNNLTQIHHVCSLGTLCQSSQLLKDIGLKKESYPFDWIFSNTKNIINIIEDDFSQFLNKELYISINSKQCGHETYGSNMFYHHNPKDNDNDYSYFIRCVARFRKLLKKESNKLFIITFPNVSNDKECIERIKEDVINLNKYISTVTTNYYIFAICHIPKNQIRKISILDIDNIKILSIYTKSASNGLRLEEHNENKMLIKLLLTSYSFQVKKLE